MRKKILFVAMVLCTVCVLKNEKEETDLYDQLRNEKILTVSNSSLRAGITPPIKRPRPPQKMYEEPVSVVAESHKLA